MKILTRPRRQRLSRVGAIGYIYVPKCVLNVNAFDLFLTLLRRFCDDLNRQISIYESYEGGFEIYFVTLGVVMMYL